MTEIHYLPPVLGALGLCVAFVLYRGILKWPAGEGKVVEIGDAIHQGALVFLKREYMTLGIFVIISIVLPGL